MTRSHFQKAYHPELTGDKAWTWRLPTEFRENEGLLVLGLLQTAMSDGKATSCMVDLTNVEWADPQPLLCLALVLAESGLPKKAIVLDLGSTVSNPKTDAHRIFLKFVAQQGFLTAMSEHMSFRCNGNLFTTTQEIQDLRLNLAAEPQSTYFQNANCIFARIIKTDHFRENQAALQIKVEEILREAHERAIGSAFGAEPLARDMLFQKLRKLLYELLLNVAEHSHAEGQPAYAGVYARIRGAKPPVESDAKAWNDLFANGISIYGQTQFSLNPYAEWLELFVCDVGRGLVSAIYDWVEPDDPEVAIDLRKAKKAQNPLESIATRLFRNALSRYPRHDANRTAVTGLQYVGHLLAINGDYCRIYTQNGTWVGGHLPWQESSYSRQDLRVRFRNKAMAMQYHGLIPVSGTAYAFSIQPEHRNTPNTPPPWVEPCEHCRDAILEALRSKTTYDPPVATEFYDRRTENFCSAPTSEELSSDIPSVIVLRPPRSMSKLDVSRWLGLVAGNPSERATRPAKIFVLADLSPFQTLAFHELLLNVRAHLETKLDLYLVSEHWAVCCLTKSQDSTRFLSAEDNAQQFLHSPISGVLFCASHLAIMLRQMDSELFWRGGSEEIFEPFFNRPVDWIESTDKEQVVRLKRYLDFPHALADPERYRACRRALRRCLALFPGCRPEAADNLVTSLLRDAALGGIVSSVNVGDPVVAVGSIAVTAGTVSRLQEEYGCQSIHMLVHGDTKYAEEPKPLAALLWISDLLNVEDNITSKDAVNGDSIPWRRIPNTPYIAPLGEQAISILRYMRKENGALDFSRPLYGRTPVDTYNDFQRLGILKAGHWKYGSLHDLLTVNTGLAFKYSVLELGPLYYWIKAQFTLLFSKQDAANPPLAHLLIYPSHPVTDAIMDRIRQDAEFADILPLAGMIPVKFLGEQTVSPLLASHLVAYHIKQKIHALKLAKWGAVVLDDGVVSGKHMRELTQFLQGLNSKNIYTLALLDRTGLPAQEAVLDRYFARHKRFWRWDVPSLGNTRDCSLCQGLAIAQTFAHRLISLRHKQRLQQWVELWRVRDVDTEWHNGGLRPILLAPPIEVTFGVDERPDGTRTEEKVPLSNSTAVTSILLELTRLTTRADTALKKARIAETFHPDAAIEIIATQLLLFLDELSQQQRRERFRILLKLIWSETVTTQAMSLAGLCFTLADHKVLKYLWQECQIEFLPKLLIGNLDAILAANILRSRYTFLTKKAYQLCPNASDIERYNYVMLGGSGDLSRFIRDFLAIYRNPNVNDCLNTHTTRIRQTLETLSEGFASKSYSLTMQTELSNLLRDVRLIEQVLANLRDELVVVIDDYVLDKLNDQAKNLELALDKSRQSAEEIELLMPDLKQSIQAIILLLYGDGAMDGTLRAVADQLFRHYRNVSQLDNELIAGIVRSVRTRWTTTVSAKEHVQQNEEVRNRWRKAGEVVLPNIRCSESTEITNIWLYCDSFAQKAIEEAISNVYHARNEISDPWSENTENDVALASIKAHLWWRAERDGDYIIIETVNATANQMIVFKQTVNISSVERVGGSLEVWVENDLVNGTLAYTNLHLPLYSAFIKEKPL